MDNLIEINIGGTTFLIEKSILKKYPETRLGLINFQSEEYLVERGFFYFNRNPEIFNIILDFYRNDTVHLPFSICSSLVQAELEFWRIPFLHVAECCRSRFLNSDNEQEAYRKIHYAFGTNNNHLKEDDTNSNKQCGLQQVWLLCNEPLSSRAAKAYSIVYLLIVLLSVVMTFLFTVHEFREKAFDLDTLINKSKSAFGEVTFNVNSSKEVLFITTRMSEWWYQLDRGFMGYFTIEFIVRFISCPSKQTFAKCWFNILDALLNISMWIRFGIELKYEHLFTASNNVIIWVWILSYSMVSLRILRFLRVNSQYFELRVLLLTLKQSMKELLLLFVSFILLATVFANFIFLSEYEDPTAFPSTFSSLWWSVITMTTVGYGDTVPKSIPGKVIGGACAVCGLLVIAMPVTIVASKFNDNYRKMKDIVKFKQKISVNKSAKRRSRL